MLSVSPQEFAYLRLQRGDIDHLSHDFNQWLPAYQDKLEETFQSIKPHLPGECFQSLDIGSGLGGINILISKYYVDITGKRPRSYLLDGLDDKARIVSYAQTFSNRALALGFLYRHGVNALGLIPKYLDCTKVAPFDLITSFAAWGFHIPTDYYLSYVLDHSHQDTIMIVDARRPRAVEEFGRYFNVVEVAENGKKYDRLVMRKR